KEHRIDVQHPEPLGVLDDLPGLEIELEVRQVVQDVCTTCDGTFCRHALSSSLTRCQISKRKTSQLTAIAAPAPTTTGTSGRCSRTRSRNNPPNTTTHFSNVPNANRRMVTAPRASDGLNTRNANAAVPTATTPPPPNAPRADAAP